MPFGMRWHARGRWYRYGKPGRAPQHAQAYHVMLYRANKHQIRVGWMEGSSIVDESGEC